MLKKYFNKKSYLFKYISVLFIVLLVPTIFGSVVSELSLHATLNQIKERNYQSLAHIQRSMDASLSEIKQLSIQVATSDGLLAYSEAPANTYTGFELQTFDFFPKDAVTRSYIGDIFIYNKKNNVLINNNRSLFTIDQYCDNILGIQGKEKEIFVQILNTPSFCTVFPAMDIKLLNRVVYKPYIFVTQSYPLMETFDGNVVVLLNVEEMISGFADKFENGGSAFFILDENSSILLEAGDEKFVSTEYANVREGHGHSKLNGESVTYCVRDSITENLKYVFIESDRSVQSGVTPIRTAIILYLLIVLFGGSLGIYWIAKRNTQPVREISNMLESADHKKESGDEFEHIQSAIRNILSEKARMEPILEESETTLRKMLISDILRGNFMSADQIAEACKKVEISFLHAHFCVIYFSLDEIPQEDVPIIKYAISNIVSEVFAPVGEVFADDSELHSLVSIINLTENNSEIENTILSQLSFIRTFFVENFDTVINIGVGTILTGAEQISTSYSQAKEAAEYCALTGSKNILPYTNIKNADYRYSYPLEVEDKLHSAVISGNIDAVRELIDQIVSANASLSLDMSRCLFFDLTATALKIISNKAINITAVFDKDDAPFEKLMECKSIAELVETIHGIFEKICDQITENHIAKKEKLKIAITDYVKLHYNNPNMSLSLVADEFSMNYTYMSHFFKDFIGANFIDYISDLRIKKAQELLRTTDLPINEIATTVGYANATVLIKIFKKITNTTPGAYRKSSKI
ncbi:MAG: helix-turn-helix domain-containing protein [Clostridia bacterium]|nr:helix-turn-helix domain-containing protein [Clostridia bacterium]